VGYVVVLAWWLPRTLSMHDYRGEHSSLTPRFMLLCDGEDLSAVFIWEAPQLRRIGGSGGCSEDEGEIGGR
jgi:hypothetical protein